MKRLSILCLAFVMAGCSSGSKATEMKGEGSFTNSKGEKTTAKVTMKDKDFTAVSIDETAKDKGGKTKKELGNDYNMKVASSIGKEWYEQVDFLEKYIVKNGVDKIKVNSEGKAENEDVKAGCTISVDGFLKAVKEAQQNAK